MHRYVRILLVAIFALGLAACGGGGDGGAGDGGAGDGSLTVTAPGGFEFEPEEATAQAGEFTVEFVNEDSQRHTFVIDDPSIDLDARGGGSDSGTVTLEAGTYEFYCDVPGHREGGMVGTLEVE